MANEIRIKLTSDGASQVSSDFRAVAAEVNRLGGNLDKTFKSQLTQTEAAFRSLGLGGSKAFKELADAASAERIKAAFDTIRKSSFATGAEVDKAAKAMAASLSGLNTNAAAAGAGFGKFQAAASSASAALGQAGINTGIFGQAIAALTSPIGLAAVGLGALAVAITHTTEFMTKNYEQMRGLIAVSGLSADAADQLADTFDLLGFNVDALRGALFKMSAEIDSGGKGMRALGVEIRDSTGNLKVEGDLFLEVRDKISALGSASQRNAALIDIFGRSGRELAGVFALSETEFRKWLETAGKMGPSAEESMRVTKEYTLAAAALNKEWQGLTETAGQKLLPILTRMLQALRGLAETKPGEAAEAWDDWMSRMLLRMTPGIGLLMRLTERAKEAKVSLDDLFESPPTGGPIIQKGAIEEITKFTEQLQVLRADALDQPIVKINQAFEEFKDKWGPAAAVQMKRLVNELIGLERAKQADAAFQGLSATLGGLADALANLAQQPGLAAMFPREAEVNSLMQPTLKAFEAARIALIAMKDTLPAGEFATRMKAFDDAAPGIRQYADEHTRATMTIRDTNAATAAMTKQLFDAEAAEAQFTRTGGELVGEQLAFERVLNELTAAETESAKAVDNLSVKTIGFTTALQDAISAGLTSAHIDATKDQITAIDALLQSEFLTESKRQELLTVKYALESKNRVAILVDDAAKRREILIAETQAQTDALALQNTAAQRQADASLALIAEQQRAAGDYFGFLGTQFGIAIAKSTDMWAAMTTLGQQTAQGLQSAFSDFFTTFATELAAGKGLWESFTSALDSFWKTLMQSMIKAVADFLAAAVVRQLAAFVLGLLGDGSGGDGGVFGAILGGIALIAKGSSSGGGGSFQGVGGPGGDGGTTFNSQTVTDLGTLTGKAVASWWEGFWGPSAANTGMLEMTQAELELVKTSSWLRQTFDSITSGAKQLWASLSPVISALGVVAGVYGLVVNIQQGNALGSVISAVSTIVSLSSLISSLQAPTAALGQTVAALIAEFPTLTSMFTELASVMGIAVQSATALAGVGSPIFVAGGGAATGGALAGAGAAGATFPVAAVAAWAAVAIAIKSIVDEMLIIKPAELLTNQIQDLRTDIKNVNAGLQRLVVGAQPIPAGATTAQLSAAYDAAINAMGAMAIMAEAFAKSGTHADVSGFSMWSSPGQMLNPSGMPGASHWDVTVQWPDFTDQIEIARKLIPLAIASGLKAEQLLASKGFGGWATQGGLPTPGPPLINVSGMSVPSMTPGQWLWALGPYLGFDIGKLLQPDVLRPLLGPTGEVVGQEFGGSTTNGMPNWLPDVLKALEAMDPAHILDQMIAFLSTIPGFAGSPAELALTGKSGTGPDKLPTLTELIQSQFESIPKAMLAASKGILSDADAMQIAEAYFRPLYDKFIELSTMKPLVEVTKTGTGRDITTPDVAVTPEQLGGGPLTADEITRQLQEIAAQVLNAQIILAAIGPQIMQTFAAIIEAKRLGPEIAATAGQLAVDLRDQIIAVFEGTLTGDDFKKAMEDVANRINLLGPMMTVIKSAVMVNALLPADLPEKFRAAMGPAYAAMLEAIKTGTADAAKAAIEGFAALTAAWAGFGDSVTRAIDVHALLPAGLGDKFAAAMKVEYDRILAALEAGNAELAAKMLEHFNAQVAAWNSIGQLVNTIQGEIAQMSLTTLDDVDASITAWQALSGQMDRTVENAQKAFDAAIASGDVTAIAAAGAALHDATMARLAAEQKMVQTITDMIAATLKAAETMVQNVTRVANWEITGHGAFTVITALLDVLAKTAQSASTAAAKLWAVQQGLQAIISTVSAAVAAGVFELPADITAGIIAGATPFLEALQGLIDAASGAARLALLQQQAAMFISLAEAAIAAVQQWAQQAITGAQNAAQAQIDAIDVQIAAIEEAARIEQEARNLEIEGLRDRIQAAREWATAIEGAEKFMEQLKAGPLAPINPRDQLIGVQDTFNTALAAFMANPTAQGLTDLQSMAQAVLQAAEPIFSKPSPQFQTLFALITGQLKAAQELASQQAEDADVLQAQLDELEQLNKQAANSTTLQIAALNSQKKAITDGLAGTIAAIKAAAEAEITRINDGLGAVLLQNAAEQAKLIGEQLDNADKLLKAVMSTEFGAGIGDIATYLAQRQDVAIATLNSILFAIYNLGGGPGGGPPPIPAPLHGLGWTHEGLHYLHEAEMVLNAEEAAAYRKMQSMSGVRIYNRAPASSTWVAPAARSMVRSAGAGGGMIIHVTNNVTVNGGTGTPKEISKAVTREIEASLRRGRGREIIKELVK